MFKKSLILTSLLSAVSTFSFAEENKNSFDVNGTIRFKYTHNDYLPDSGNTIDFADGVLWLNYKNDHLTGHLDYRIYQAYGKLGGIHLPVNAWIDYELQPDHHLKAGLQSVPVGLGRYQSSTYNLTQLYHLGLEDLNNWGLTYQYSPEDLNLTAGYFFHDAGSYTGKSKNSAHYSSNLTVEPGFTNGTQLDEKHTIALRADKTLHYKLNENPVHIKIGASYLYSELDNKITHQTGDRQVWSVFQNTKINNFGFNLIYGNQSINNKDIQYKDVSTFGFFDGQYNVANEANFLSTEINYTLASDFKHFNQPLFYSNYSRYFKKSNDFNDSERFINGVTVKYKKNFQFYLENITSKNDTVFGPAADGYAEGSENKWNNLTYLSLGYYF